MDEHADRPEEPWDPRRVHRVLRRPEGPARRDRGDWPAAVVQTCVVHLVRNSLLYTSTKDWSKITNGLRGIYTAPTCDAAELEFELFAERGGSATRPSSSCGATPAPIVGRRSHRKC